LLFYSRNDFCETWTDEKLYKKYGLTEDEIASIESMIRPMNPPYIQQKRVMNSLQQKELLNELFSVP